MKKNKLFFVLSVMSVLPLWSQTSYQSVAFYAQLPYSVEKTIIRELEFPTSISYVETEGPHYFVYHDGDTNQLNAIIIESDLYVNDFVIENDTVFFCGYNTISGYGFLGYFPIQDFFFNTHNYTTTNFTFQFSQDYIRSFDKMVTYTDDGQRKFALIGLLYSRSYAVTEIIVDPYMTVCQYSIGLLEPANNESLLQIALTKNYVVTSGFKTTTPLLGPLPSIRIYLRSAMFANNGPQDVATYVYESSSINTYFYGDQMALSPMVSDQFAIAAYCKDNLNSSTPRGTYVGIYDVGTNNSIIHSGSIKTDQNSFYQNGGWMMRGMTPLKHASRFYLLQNAELIFQVDGLYHYVNMLFEMNYNSIYNTSLNGSVPILYREDPYLESIDASGNVSCFVTNGYYQAHPNDPHLLAYYNSLALTSPQCHDSENIAYDCLYMNSAQVTNDPFVVNSGAGTLFQSYVGVEILLDIELGCYE